MKTLVKFTKPWSIYSPGDIAGFDADRAETLIKGAIAEPYKEAARKEVAKVPDQNGADAKVADTKVTDQKTGK